MSKKVLKNSLTYTIIEVTFRFFDGNAFQSWFSKMLALNRSFQDLCNDILYIYVA